jgi:hypothetical protein
MEPGERRRIERLYQRVVATRTNCRFEDLERLLVACGFERRAPGSGSSHVTFRRPAKGNRPAQRIPIPKHRPVKTYYVNDVLAMLGDRPWEGD